MMVWDDRSSMSIPGLSMFSKGFMNTHDEVTRKWFAQNAPNVKLALVGRTGDEGNSLLEGQAASTFFSHHQASSLGACHHCFRCLKCRSVEFHVLDNQQLHRSRSMPFTSFHLCL